MARDAKRSVDVGFILDDRWEIIRVLGEGAFGTVYEVGDTTRAGKRFALKLESNEHRGPGDPEKMIPLEVTVLRALRDNGAKLYPGYESCGQNERFNYVVMGLVGKNVDSVRKAMPRRRFSLRSCLHIAIESSRGLEEIHDAGFLHRDMKPQNMAIGRAPNDLRSLYILDWGLCRKYVNDQGKVHRPRIKAPFRGTPRYASANALAEVEQGRVDDMWSWIFTLIELTVGKLPWDDEPGPKDIGTWMAWLAKKKRKCVDDPDVMLQGCPREYKQIYDSMMATEYAAKPDYNGWNNVLRTIMVGKGYTNETLLDWEPQGEGAGRAANAPNHTMMMREDDQHQAQTENTHGH